MLTDCSVDGTEVSATQPAPKPEPVAAETPPDMLPAIAKVVANQPQFCRRNDISELFSFPAATI